MTNPRTDKHFDHVDPSTLNPYAKNSKRHPEQQINKLCRSIEKFGFVAPVIVGSENTILAGHARIVAATKLGLESVPVVFADHLSPQEQRAYVIADNRLSEMAEWDEEILADELQAIMVDDDGLDLMSIAGFTSNDLDELLHDPETSEDITNGGEDGRPTTVHKLKFGEEAAPMTPEEMDLLVQAWEDHRQQTGSQYGFVTTLLGLDYEETEEEAPQDAGDEPGDENSSDEPQGTEEADSAGEVE